MTAMVASILLIEQMLYIVSAVGAVFDALIRQTEGLRPYQSLSVNERQ